MVKTVTEYRIFIGSPGGLEAERTAFRNTIDRFNRAHARHHGVRFEPVGWEDTLPGAGRPQAKINEDLEQCDYAVFLFHDRWGSPASTDGGKVGTEEEWELAEHLHSKDGGYRLRQIAIYFKDVPQDRINDPGPQLHKVLDFKRKIFGEKQHLCGRFPESVDFAHHLNDHLGEWLALHVNSASQTKPSDLAQQPSPKPRGRKKGQTEAASFDAFAFWNQQGVDEYARQPVDQAAALIFFDRAVQAATADSQIAQALFNKGVTLGALGRSEDELAVYDDLLVRFGDSSAPAIQEQVAMALRNKGVTLGALGRSEDALAVCDDLLARFGDSSAPAMQESTQRAMQLRDALRGGGTAA